MISVDVIDADGRVADARCTRFRVADRDFLPREDLGSARAFNLDGMHQRSPESMDRVV
jgi:hypothetical protein